MRRDLLFPVFVVAVAFAWPVRGAALQSTSTLGVQRRTLPNGLEIIVVQNSAAPLATALVAVHNGAFTQDSGESGLAHLYEHLLFHTFRNNPQAFGLEATKLNGRYNGTTSEEVVTYYVSVPSKNIERAIGLLADLLIKAGFSNGALKSERVIVLDELHRYESDPEGDLQRRVHRALWGTTWHRKDVGGDSSSLQGISLDRLKATYTRYYVPNNSALIVTGDVEPQRVFAVAEREFKDWKPAPNPFADRPIPAMAPTGKTTAILVAKDVLDVTILVAMAGPSVGDDPGATYAADVLFDVFNDASAAFQRRLVDQGPFESITGNYLTLNHTGLIEFRGKTKPENSSEAIGALVGELKNLDLLDGITDDDLVIARKRRQVSGALARERTASLAPSVAFWWSAAGMDYYLAYNGHMAAQTADSLRRFARTYVVSRPIVIGVLGAAGDIAQIGDWLRRATQPNPAASPVAPPKP